LLHGLVSQFVLLGIGPKTVHRREISATASSPLKPSAESGGGLVILGKMPVKCRGSRLLKQSIKHSLTHGEH